MPRIMSNESEYILEKDLLNAEYTIIPQYRLDGFSKKWRVDFYLPKENIAIAHINCRNIYHLSDAIYTDLFKLSDLKRRDDKLRTFIFSCSVPLRPALKVAKDYGTPITTTISQLLNLIRQQKTIDEINEEILTSSPRVRWTRTKCLLILRTMFNQKGRFVFRDNESLGIACRKYFGSWNNALKVAGIPLNHSWNKRKIPLIEHAKICKLYKDGGSTCSISKLYSVATDTIGTILEKNKMQLRSHSEAMILAYKGGRR